MSQSWQGKNKAITFSYDDGVTQDIRLIELLNKYNLKCTFNLNSGLLSKKSIIVRNDNKISHYKVHPDDVKYIYDGHEVAAHTLTHPLLTQCDTQEIIRQVETDRLNLSQLVGYEVVGMAYPCGAPNTDDRVANIIRENTGVKFARTVISNNSFEKQKDLLQFDPSVYHLRFDDMFKLGKEFIELKTETPKIFYIWGHSYEMDFESDYWVKLEDFFKLVSGKDDIFYGTNKEVLL